MYGNADKSGQESAFARISTDPITRGNRNKSLNAIIAQAKI